MPDPRAAVVLLLRFAATEIRTGCALPFLLALVLAGCGEKHSESEIKPNGLPRNSVLSDSRVPQVERPPFYDSNNLAEFYGRCPRCNGWAKGYWKTWDNVDSKVPGAAAGVNGACENCHIELMADDPAAFTSATRIVRWKTGW